MKASLVRNILALTRPARRIDHRVSAAIERSRATRIGPGVALAAAVIGGPALMIAGYAGHDVLMGVGAATEVLCAGYLLGLSSTNS